MTQVLVCVLMQGVGYYDNSIFTAPKVHVSCFTMFIAIVHLQDGMYAAPSLTFYGSTKHPRSFRYNAYNPHGLLSYDSPV